MKVQKAVAVIPPARVQKRFHQPGGYVFQRCRERGAGKKQREDIVLEGVQERDDRHRAHPINGAHRPVQETTVH